MRSLVLHTRKSNYFIIAAFLFINAGILHAQQNMVMNKDNTRPETTRQMNTAFISALTTTKHNGYNEIQWSALEKAPTNRFFIEYSFDGTNFLSAGPVSSNTGIYSHKHYIADNRPILYRIRTEIPAGAQRYSKTSFVEGVNVPPVQIYTTNVKGHVINARVQFPVERVIIVSAGGVPVLTKDINGATDFIPIDIPSLKEGMYFITFYGNDWKSTSQFFYES
jgi:hypothetical protein